MIDGIVAIGLDCRTAHRSPSDFSSSHEDNEAGSRRNSQYSSVRRNAAVLSDWFGRGNVASLPRAQRCEPSMVIAFKFQQCDFQSGNRRLQEILHLEMGMLHRRNRVPYSTQRTMSRGGRRRLVWFVRRVFLTKIIDSCAPSRNYYPPDYLFQIRPRQPVLNRPCLFSTSLC